MINPPLMCLLAAGLLLIAAPHQARADDGLQGTIDPDYFQLRPESLDNFFMPWATPLDGGPIKATIIAPLSAGREIAELQRRLDCQARTVLVKPHVGLPENQLGFDPGPFGHYNAVAGFTQQEMIDKLQAALRHEADLIVIGNVDWSILTEPIQQRIEEMVSNGVGLLLVQQSAATAERWKQKIAPVETRQASPPTIALQQVDELISEAVPQTRRGPDRLESGLYGKGRVTILDWQEPPGDRTNRVALTLSHALTPSWPICLFTRDGWAYEFEMAAVIKAALHTSRRQPFARISRLDLPPAAAVGESVLVAVEITADKAAALTLEYALRDLQNQVVHRDRLSLSLAAGQNQVKWSIALPAGGTFALDVVLRQGSGTLDFAAGVVRSASDQKLTLMIDHPKRLPGQPLTGTLALSAPAHSGDQAVELEVYDARNRLLASRRLRVNAKEPTAFSLDPIESLTAYNRVVAARKVDGATVERAEADCIVDRRGQSRNEYHVTMWNWVPSDYLTSVFLKRYAELGIDSLYHNDYFKFELPHLERGTWQAARLGIETIPYFWRDYAYAQKDLHDVVRSPVLSSPDYRQSVQHTISTYAALAAKFAAPFCTLGDEPYLVGFWEGVQGRDVCFAPQTQAAFRLYLKNKYPSLDALNRAWGTSFQDWNDVSPIIFEDALAQGNLARWLDHRQHMTSVFQGMLDFEQDVVRQIDPQMPAGPEGLYPWDPFKGYDFERLSQMGLIGLYGPSHGELSYLACAQVADYHAPGNRRLTIAGWYNTVPRSREYSWSDFWWAAFHGYNGTLYFLGDTGSTMSGFTPDHRPVQYLRDTLQAVHELRAGLFTLIQGTSRNNRQVAILHSQASYILSLSLANPASVSPDAVFTTGPSESLAPSQAVRWARLLNDAGIPHAHLTTRQVEAGALRDVRVLILPVALCLSDRETQEIRNFVDAGGILVADVLPGVLNPDGGPRQGGCLDDLFGVVQTDAALTPINQTLTVSGADLPIERSGRISLRAATAAASLQGHPLLVQNRHGQGKALLLNTTMLAYDALRKQGRHGAYAACIGDWLKRAGAPARFQLLPVGRGQTLEMIPYVDGSLEYLALVKQPRYTPPGSEPFHIKLPQRFHVYDVRQQEYLGETDRIQGQCAGDNPRFFALLPYRVEALRMDRPASPVQRGHVINLSASIVAATGSPGRHVIRFEVSGPQGPLPHYTRIVNAPLGRGDCSIPTALNDPVGTWTLKAREIVSGQEAATTVELK